MYEQINGRFELNLKRVDSLISIYETYLHKPGQGRRKVTETDVLRAAVVLLHAAVEDFLRSLLVWKLPLAPAQRLNDIPLLSNDPKKTATKFWLGELAQFRGMTVEDLIAKSVASHLEGYQSFNNIGDVVSALADCQLSPEGLDRAAIEEMIKRRHNIVHKADRNQKEGKQGLHKVASLTPNAVRGFLTAVRTLQTAVTDQHA